MSYPGYGAVFKCCTVFVKRSEVKLLLHIFILLALHRVSAALRLCSGSSFILLPAGGPMRKHTCKCFFQDRNPPITVRIQITRVNCCD